MENVEKPLPRDDEILVRVHATTVSAADWRFRKAAPFFVVRPMIGLLRPKKNNTLGLEFAGTVEKRGANVTQFRERDRVFGSMGFRMGAYAEYVCVGENRLLAVQPRNATDEEAAAIPFGGISALHFLRRAKIAAGQNVLVYGASGSVGTYAVQLAKHFGAHVSAVCSTENLELVKSLGADEVIDYTRQDFSKAGPVYDIVFDAVGKSGLRRSMRVLKRGGVLVGVGLSSILGGLWARMKGYRTVSGGMARSQPGDLHFLKSLVEAGKIRPVIDRRYPFTDIADAHRYVEAGHKKGNVVIVIAKRPPAANPTPGARLEV